MVFPKVVSRSPDNRDPIITRRILNLSLVYILLAVREVNNFNTFAKCFSLNPYLISYGYSLSKTAFIIGISTLSFQY